MKASHTMIALMALFGAGSFAIAQEGAADKPGEGAPQRERGPRPERPIPPSILKKYDKDGDGKLNDEERTTMREEQRARREAHRKAMLEKYDANKDGKLDADEAKTMRETERKNLLEKYDADKDGKLNPEERKAAVEAGEVLGGFGGERRGEGRRGRGPAQDEGQKEAPTEEKEAPADEKKAE